MKTTKTIKTSLLIAVLGTALATAGIAQPGPGPGAGGGPVEQGAGPAAAGANSNARGMRGMRFDRSNTPGWTLMSAEERAANKSRMRSVQSYDECKQVLEEQHKKMEARAKEKGIVLNQPGQNGCDMAKARGLIK
jgi:hypothetical protein